MKRFKYLGIWIVAVFILGFFCSEIYSGFASLRAEQPFSLSADEIKSPGDWISEKDVIIKGSYVIIKAKNATWAKFADTNSMDPVLDANANSIEIKPKSAEQLHIGDIISYRSNFINGYVVHRIVDIKQDEKGIYFATKGDNSWSIDPQKVRFSDIKGVVIGVLY